MKVVVVTDKNRAVYNNLAQAYEAEFSRLTAKKPLANGVFELDTNLDDAQVTGFICYKSGTPAGIAAVYSEALHDNEIAEFYIVPFFRKAELGTQFAHMLWQQRPGLWTIKQIAGAQYATRFWLSAIKYLPGENLIEDQYEDEYWGKVTRQRFVSTE
ncbi:hypothetical protein [Pseudoalteromonas luteoviolacea]|uniref:N-acetyltransferase domain-containing protein n=1 Tax=Pseudoalteromonas luteoviolacea NCIMB 1942 TaxID=1365253 RepID=A0A167E817_9GAMM|nr:hypothetical protein [Pseudoalteromonas luteoviolacea]KZN50187.1 hypothetical protein N482_06360 [Pseudoalteromonas luteoviolacea NCIMB 1942]KZW99808.1 hypothetical protein JL49_15065 [Pseudoalteromonas luteoviolacea]